MENVIYSKSKEYGGFTTNNLQSQILQFLFSSKVIFLNKVIIIYIYNL